MAKTRKIGGRRFNGITFYFTGGYDSKREARLAARDFLIEHGKKRQYRIARVKDVRGDFWGFYAR